MIRSVPTPCGTRNCAHRTPGGESGAAYATLKTLKTAIGAAAPMGGETRLHIAGAGELLDIDLAAEADKLEADERRLVPSVDKDA